MPTPFPVPRRLLAVALTLTASVIAVGCDVTDVEPDVRASARTSESAPPAHADTYVLLARTALPADLRTRVADAGGEVTRVLPEIGVAFARSRTAGFRERAARIGGLSAVAPDLLVEWVSAPEAEGAPADLGGIAADEPFAFLQWSLEAVDAPGAWAQGATGAGVRVAIIDGGLYDEHVDLRTQIDRDASRSFVPGFAWNEDNPANTFWHGTHVAGIVGAADNGRGTIGVAPGATLIGVKALHDFTGGGSGTGAFSWIIEAVYYAATPVAEGGAGADVINMSLGTSIDVDAANRAAVRELSKAVDRATRYAWQRGVLVVSSAGNGGTDYDAAKSLVKVPAEGQHVAAVSATGPTGWALGDDDFAQLAYYSDYGKSLVEVSAPGGNYAYAFEDLEDGAFDVCSVRFVTQPCYAFDGVLSTVRGTTTASYNWSEGTSMASPMVAGVAALVMERFGTGNPARTMARIRSTATDLGKPGKDAVYGHGWVNAAAAVGAPLASN